VGLYLRHRRECSLALTDLGTHLEQRRGAAELLTTFVTGGLVTRRRRCVPAGYPQNVLNTPDSITIGERDTGSLVADHGNRG
jgi:hypothetical protein